MIYLSSLKKYLVLSLTTLLTLVILLSIVGPALAQEIKAASGRNAPPAPVQAQGPTDPAEMEAFLDELLGNEMEEHHIAGRL